MVTQRDAIHAHFIVAPCLPWVPVLSAPTMPQPLRARRPRSHEQTGAPNHLGQFFTNVLGGGVNIKIDYQD
jgi:hypothetical protein